MRRRDFLKAAGVSVGCSLLVCADPIPSAASLEERVNLKIQQLSQALAKLSLRHNSLPTWVRTVDRA
jgi:hypothetical protein